MNTQTDFPVIACAAPTARTAVAFVIAVATLLAFGSSPGSAQNADAARTESELRGIRAEIERVKQQVSRDAAEKDRLTRDLKSAELSAGEARERLERLRHERADRSARRASLGKEMAEERHQLGSERSALAGQIRAAYLIGREEPLKLLLNQRDPAQAGRMFAYYSYFGRARAVQIERIKAHVAAIGTLDAALVDEENRLAALEAQQRTEVAKLDSSRVERGRVLATLKSEASSRAAALERLRRQQASLEKLLRELRRAIERFPTESKDAFAAIRGKLAWPLAGKLVARFGETRSGAIKWDGVMLDAERGTAVHAIYHGRVVYADWLAGLGLLVIVDHGDGYLSLYAHNDSLLKRVGERVTAGDAVATAGDSGGRARTGLYFEIRKNGKPIDPKPWFRGAPDNS